MKELTVFMPVYNAAAFLKEAIESVLNQNHDDFEFLIIDDGSTDNSKEIILSFSDPRIKLLSNPHNYIATLNQGIESSCGKYIVRFDADDVMLPNRLSIQYQFMEDHSEIDVCGSYIELFGDFNETITGYPLSHKDITNLLIIRCPLANSSSCIRKDFLKQHNIRYSDEHIYCEDYKLWADIAMAGGVFSNIPEVLLRYRCYNGQVSSTHHSEQQNGSIWIRQEIIEWFLSQVKQEHPLGKKMIHDIIPSLNELNLYNILSPATYSQSLYEIVCKLRDRKIIEI